MKNVAAINLTAIAQVEKRDIVESVIQSGDEIIISLSSTMDVMSAGGYEISDCGYLSVAPEEFSFEEEIRIDLDTLEIKSGVTIYSCNQDKQGDWETFSILYGLPNYGRDILAEEGVKALLERLDSEFKDFDGQEGGEAIEMIDQIETHPHDAYRNTRLTIGKRPNSNEYFYEISDNHVAHNQNDLRSRTWIPISEKEENNNEDDFGLSERYGEDFIEMLEHYEALEEGYVLPYLKLKEGRGGNSINLSYEVKKEGDFAFPKTGGITIYYENQGECYTDKDNIQIQSDEWLCGETWDGVKGGLMDEILEGRIFDLEESFKDEMDFIFRESVWHDDNGEEKTYDGSEYEIEVTITIE